MDRSSPESVLVVVEGTAASPLWMSHWGQAPSSDWAMVEEEAGEARRHFSERVGTALVRFQSDRPEQRAVLLVAGHAADAMAVAARWDLATTVLTHLAQSGGGKLLFTRGMAAADGRKESTLQAFVDELASEWEWAGIEIGIRHQEAPRTPQVRRASAPPFPSYRAPSQVAAQAI